MSRIRRNDIGGLGAADFLQPAPGPGQTRLHPLADFRIIVGGREQNVSSGEFSVTKQTPEKIRVERDLGRPELHGFRKRNFRTTAGQRRLRPPGHTLHRQCRRYEPADRLLVPTSDTLQSDAPAHLHGPQMASRADCGRPVGKSDAEEVEVDLVVDSYDFRWTAGRANHLISDLHLAERANVVRKHEMLVEKYRLSGRRRPPIDRPLAHHPVTDVVPRPVGDLERGAVDLSHRGKKRYPRLAVDLVPASQELPPLLPDHEVAHDVVHRRRKPHSVALLPTGIGHLPTPDYQRPPPPTRCVS